MYCAEVDETSYLPDKGQRKVKERWNPELERVDYVNDQRTITGKFFGDPMPERSALYKKEHP